ncbi:mannosyl-oligosaccharide alpha-1,2-mannosidase [Halocaridina rubra]|uniref:Meiosis-specific nuclear structural protein 1 n=1 Tax=Halocaridina rubra TaxID=373956 RepID=A0AAN8ZVI5_HALRR
MENYLRRQIITSSPELRALEAQIRAFAEVKYNNAAVAEKEFMDGEKKAKERQYAKLVEEYGNEEVLADAITSAEKYGKRLEVERVLKDQIAEKSAVMAQLEAENTFDMLSKPDEDTQLKKENEEKLKNQLKEQETTRSFLLRQTRMKELKKQEEELEDRNTLKRAEEYNLQVHLLKEIERQQQEMERMHLNRRELALVKDIERGMEKRDVISKMRLELEILEKQAQEKQYAKEREIKAAADKARLKEGWDSQIIYKQEESMKEEEKEAAYRKLLLEVLAEEARLDCLVAEAKRRRQLDHRYLVDRLLKERRAMRATLMTQKKQEDQRVVEYEQLRNKIVEEEEKQLLFKYAPQLMPYYTPKLLSKLKELR